MFATPRKQIFEFDYANEVALQECEKRQIDVLFGHELISVQENYTGAKIATFRNVDTGETFEKDFFTGCINPPSKPVEALMEAGLTTNDGLLDVNKYTLQHKRYENIFGFGDCIGGFQHTRTQLAA